MLTSNVCRYVYTYLLHQGVTLIVNFSEGSDKAAIKKSEVR